ncbi:hypothetical protein B566_EDAN004599 [Ephemera danica]|nr:hypothetical protein B566_EDAN004599 [Ephemera danica]
MGLQRHLRRRVRGESRDAEFESHNARVSAVAHNPDPVSAHLPVMPVKALLLWTRFVLCCYVNFELLRKSSFLSILYKCIIM